ncbi:MAG: SgcJ/EcaC family oxidoreductase [Nibricoccus sp.]
MKTKAIAFRYWIAGAFIALFWTQIIVSAQAGSPPAPIAAEEKAIRAIFDEYARALKAGDSKAWLALWDENGRQLFPGQPMHIGKAGIASANAPVIDDFKAGRFEMEIETQEVTVFSEGFAFASGVYHWEWTHKEPEKKTDRYDGKFLTIFKRQADGTWKIFRDAFNSNVPNA